MYVRLGQVPSIVQPANPTPQNDIVLYPRAPLPTSNLRLVRRLPGAIPHYYSGAVQQPQSPQPVPAAAQTIVGYDANGSPVYSGSQAASVTATVSASPGGLTAWLQTGNNGIYAALAVGFLLLLLTRRR